MDDHTMLVTHSHVNRSHRMRLSVIAAIACIAIVAVVAHSLPSSDVDVSLASSTTVQLCTDKDFAGSCKSAGYGRYSTMGAVGIPANSLSSLKIPAGTVVLLYDQNDFKGNVAEFKNDIKDLTSVSWNDRASSMIVQSASDRRRAEEMQIFQSVVQKVVTAEKAAAVPKTCDTCCPPVPNPLIMPPASCSDVAVDLKSISNTLASLSRIIRSQHLSDLCKVAGSIKANTGFLSLFRKHSVVPNADIAQQSDNLKDFVDSLLQQSKARVEYDVSAQTAASIKAKLDAEKAKVDALKKQQEAEEKKLRDDMAALAKAQAEQKIKDEKAKKDAADKAAAAKKVVDDLAKFKKAEDDRRAEKARLQQEAVDLKAKEAKLIKEKAEKEAALAAAKAKQEADRKAKEKADADVKAAKALKDARDAQVAADAAAFAATASGPVKDAIQKRIEDGAKKAKDAAQAIIDAQKKAADTAAKVIQNQKLISTLTDILPKIGPQISDVVKKYNDDAAKLKEVSPYMQGIQASIFRLNQEPVRMPNFESLKKSTSVSSTLLSTNIDFRDFSNSFVQQKFGFSTRFGMTLTGFIDIPSSDTWHIFIESDDGSKVFVDGSLLVDNDGLHGMFEQKGSRYLTKGKHQLLVEFSQWDYGGGLVMRWMSSQANQKQIIPASAFYVLSPNAPAPVVKDVQQINQDILTILPRTPMTGGGGGRRPPMPPVTVGPQQAVDNEALLVAQKAKELRAEQDRLAKLVRDAQAAKDAQDKAAAATAQAAAAKKIADEIAREEQRKKDEAARAKIAADSKRIDELKKAEAAAAAKLAEEKAAKELADARFQQESRYAAAAVQRAAFYSDVSDYAANLGSVITGASIGGATDSSPLQCVRACNGNPSCIAFTTSVQHSIVPGLAVTYYKAALSRLPSNWNGMNIAKEAVVPNINFPSGSVQGNSGMSTNFAAVYQGFVTIPKAGQWVFFITSDDGSKLYFDDKIVVNNDNLQGMTMKQTNAMTLAQGRHAIKVEYFNAQGNGGVILEWQGPSTPKGVVPSSAFSSQVQVPRGLNGKFYSTPSTIEKLPQFPLAKSFPLLKDASVASLNYPSSNNFGNLGLTTRFIGLFTGFITMPSSGKWTLSSESDDGSKVYIDDFLVVSNDGPHPMKEISSSIDLEKGSHSIRVEFFNGDGPGGLVLRWSGPKLAKEVIPASAFTTGPTTGNNQCRLYSSYNENSFSSESAGGVVSHAGASTYILVRAKAYPKCNYDGAGVSLSPTSFAGTNSWAISVKSVKMPQGFYLTTYPAQNYQGASKLIQATQSCMQPTNAMSYILRSADDEKARLALEAAKAKKAEEDAKAAAAKKSRDEAAAKAAAEAKKLADEQAKAKKDAADLLALKTERKRLQIKARNDALSAAKAKLDGHKYQMGLAEKNLNAVLADESAALRKWKELGESTEQARAHLEAIRTRNRQAIAAYEEAKRLHASALNEFNARSKELSDDSVRSVESF